jgi:manganese/zinc/iron transport system substrate-binding protein
MVGPMIGIASWLTALPRRFRVALGLALALTLIPVAGSAPVADRIRVTVTTTMVADLVRQVGGDRVDVTGLMGPGVDPHLYKASAGDVTKLQRADAIFYSGLLLEGKLQDVLTRLARSKKHVYAVTEAIPEKELLEPPDFGGHYDPHVWFDVPLWARTVSVVVKGLAEVRPADRALFESRGKEATAKMNALHQWATARVAEVPAAQRILVTSHDAFNYFGRAYGFKVVGLQGISTVEEAGLSAMTQLVDFVKKHKVKAIFAESSVAPNAIRRISQDAGVKIGGELFSDAMGTEGQMEHGYDLGTYEGMIRHNVNSIVEALK